MKILCYGDSNTYGYDPRSFLSDRYPDEDCWTTHLEKAGHHILNYGMNGREIPYRPMAIESAITAFSAEQADLLLIMLGSNDLLMQSTYYAEQVSDRMDAFLQAIRRDLPEQPILLLSPVPMVSGTWVQEDRLLQESARLAPLYATLAQKHSTAFIDTAQWDVPLVFDGVHFSTQGHLRFSTGLLTWINNQKHT